jgi:hypothetical protein
MVIGRTRAHAERGKEANELEIWIRNACVLHRKMLTCLALRPSAIVFRANAIDGHLTC